MADLAPKLPDPGVDWERVGETLRTIRDLRGVNATQLAAALGISRTYLSNIENGRKPLTQSLLLKATEFLVVTQLAILRPEHGEVEQ